MSEPTIWYVAKAPTGKLDPLAVSDVSEEDAWQIAKIVSVRSRKDLEDDGWSVVLVEVREVE